jgi:hypothetical protein
VVANINISHILFVDDVPLLGSIFVSEAQVFKDYEDLCRAIGMDINALKYSIPFNLLNQAHKQTIMKFLTCNPVNFEAS